ncbi:MAG: GWxTD domain-containing protein [Candidatus Aminicenantales bacterium]|jgi:GWxTD domain-containing protein
MNAKRALLILWMMAALSSAARGGGRGPAGAKMDAESEKFYQMARIIMTAEESKIFKLLPDADARKEFIKDFWDKRDPDPDSGTNVFKREYESRVAYANKHFREGGLGMNTDRGRIFIFMGPPEKVEEFFNHGDSTVRGSIIQWIYYSDDFGVEFVDERNNGQYKIRNYSGDLFGAMDLFKLGQWVGPDSVFKKRSVDFKLRYDPPKKELVVLIPAKFLLLKENAEGKLQVDLDFKFYIYENEGAKRDISTESKSFVTRDQVYEKSGDVTFRFTYPLKPGKNFVDVIIKGKEGSKGKVRKIFEIKGGP